MTTSRSEWLSHIDQKQLPQWRCCTKCHAEKHLSEFHIGRRKMLNNRATTMPNHDGYVAEVLAVCKPCFSFSILLKYRTNSEMRERLKMGMRRRSATPEGRARSAKQRIKYATKLKACIAANNAVRKGILVKPEACSCCGLKTMQMIKRIQDPSDPLAVDWLCRECHSVTIRKYAHKGLPRILPVGDMASHVSKEAR